MKSALITLVVSGVLLSACSKQAVSQATPTVTPAPITQTTATPAPDLKNAKTFAVAGLNFSFDMKEIKVKKGDTVQIIFKNTEGMHDWRVDEFNAATKKIKSGEQDMITFVADKSGTFEYYCSVGQHRQMGMKGSLIVE